MIAVLIISIIVGFMAGYGMARICSKSDGMFIVNNSDDERTRWILDVNIDPETIPKKKEIRLKVKLMEDEGDV